MMSSHHILIIAVPTIVIMILGHHFGYVRHR